jgi:predicted permease
MTNLLLLGLCFALGIWLRRSNRLPADAHQVLNAFIINVALPALILRYVPLLSPQPALLIPALVPWMLFAFGMLFFLAIGRWLGWGNRTIGGLMLSGGLANTSFVGLPMIEAFYGSYYQHIGILADQFGTYMVLSTLGTVVAMVCAGEDQRPSAGAIARKAAMFPPLQALALGILLMPFGLPDVAVAVLDRLGGTLAPLALISVGYQLRLSEIRGVRRPLIYGLFFKLLLGPALVTLVLVLGMGASGKIVQVSVFEIAMGPQIGGAIVAMQYGLNPRLVTLMVGIGIPLSIVTAAGWWLVLSAV